MNLFEDKIEFAGCTAWPY